MLDCYGTDSWDICEEIFHGGYIHSFLGGILYSQLLARERQFVGRYVLLFLIKEFVLFIDVVSFL